jgi:hypothetical protein
MYINFGLGAPFIYVEYHRRLAVALVISLEDPSDCHQSVTINLLTHQISNLKHLTTTFLSRREGTSLPFKRQFNLHMGVRQLACIHASYLHLVLKGKCVFLADLLPPATPPPPPTMTTLINCITKPLISLGIINIHDRTSANKDHIISGKQPINKQS